MVSWALLCGDAQLTSGFMDIRVTSEPGWTWKRILDFCASEDFAALALGPAMQERTASGDALTFERDAHWNAAGHALAAELIVAELRRRGWVGD